MADAPNYHAFVADRERLRYLQELLGTLSTDKELFWKADPTRYETEARRNFIDGIVLSPAPSFFRVIENDDGLYWWASSFFVQVRGHFIDDALDPIYVPKGEEAIARFNESQDFLMSVFQVSIQFDAGKRIVAEHFHDRDAQAVWIKIMQYMYNSSWTHARVETLIISVGTGSVGENWTGEACGFLLQFNDHLRELDAIGGPGGRFPPLMRKLFLQNAIDKLPDRSLPKLMNDFRTYRDVCFGEDEHEVSFEDYNKLAWKAAGQVDFDAKSAQSHGLR